MTQFLQQEGVGEHLQAGGGDGTVVINAATCGHRINKEGKDPMSVELYKKLCGWLLDWNTSDGVFGPCFLVLRWNLSCHTHNTANIQLCEIEWSSSFDAFEIYFAHMKTDQTGDNAKYSHHLYSNPCCPLICPVLALAFYFSCCCNLPQNGQSWLFPGCNQYQWFSEMLSHLIQDHEAEVSEGKSQNDWYTLNQEGSCHLHVIPSSWSINFVSMYSCRVDHGDCEGCLHAVFILGRSVCWLLSGNVALIADGVYVFPPPILFQHGMTGGKPKVLSSSLCLTMYHSLSILN